MKKPSTHFFSRLIYQRFWAQLAFLMIPAMAIAGPPLPSGPNPADFTVTGTVRSADTQEPLIGVTIVVKGTQSGTITDFNGYYEITAPSEYDTLAFSFIGYQSWEEPIAGRSVIDVLLGESVSLLDEVVIIGYGSQSRAKMTTSVSKLDNAVLDNLPYANVTSALQGAVSGLRVQTTSGQPGDAPRVVLRGGTSINNPDGAVPLYIVDGVARDDIFGLNPADIESVQVLKDAAATSIYGARGSNGVIIVTTKTGEAGSTTISYNYSFGISELQKKIPLGNAAEYVRFGRLGIMATSERSPERLVQLNGATGFGAGNDLTNNTPFTTQYLTDDNREIYETRLVNEGWESITDPADPSRTIIFKNTDWQDVMFRTAYTHNHYAAISGGTDRAAFRAGMGWQSNEGISIFTDFQRFNFNVNGMVKARDNLAFNGGVNFANTQDNQIFNPQWAFQRWLGVPPTTKLYNLDGTLNAGSDASRGNPLFLLQQYRGENNLSQSTMNLGMDWEILPGLSFRPSGSLYIVNDLDNQFINAYKTGRGAAVDSRNAESSQLTWWQRQFDAVVSYYKTVGKDHTFQFDGGFSYYDRQRFRLRAVGQNAATNNIPTLNASASPITTFSDHTQLRILGYFGRLNYDFKAKYLLSASFRYDGASNLGSENLWGLFPGGSIGWNVHKEDFWDPMASVISQLKLRASYGVNGNINGLNGSIYGVAGDELNGFTNQDGLNRGLGDFTAQGAFDAGSRYQGQSAIRNTVLPNPDLKWERSRTLDVGFDLGLLDNRLMFLFDYYRRVTDELLTSVPLPESTGFSQTITNLASLENKGVELEAVVNIIQSPSGFNWSLSGNASFNKNKILKLPDNGEENNRIGGVQVYDPGSGELIWVEGLQEGHTIGDYYTWQHLGVYATSADAAEAPLDPIITRPDKTKVAGDAILADLNGDGVTDTKDMVYVGNIFPKWTGGFSNTFSYKGLSLIVRADFITGHTIYNQSRARFIGQWQGDLNIAKEVATDSWLQEGDQTDVNRYYWADQLAQNSNFRNAAGFLRSTSRYYEKGDFLSLREVTLSYTFPQFGAFERIGLSNMRLYVSGQNLHYFTEYTYQVPEFGGVDQGRYPNPRSYIFGLNASF